MNSEMTEEWRAQPNESHQNGCEEQADVNAGNERMMAFPQFARTERLGYHRVQTKQQARPENAHGIKQRSADADRSDRFGTDSADHYGIDDPHHHPADLSHYQGTSQLQHGTKLSPKRWEEFDHRGGPGMIHHSRTCESRR